LPRNDSSSKAPSRTRDGKHVYGTEADSSSVAVIDTDRNMVVGLPIPVGKAPFGVAVTVGSLPVTALGAVQQQH
jgi:YVTN family beta-propeller protein